MALGITDPPIRGAFPLFLHRENKAYYFLIYAALFLLLYMSSNHFPIFPPRELPMSWLDNATPFLPHSFWIYNSEIWFFVAVWFVSKDDANVNKYLYSFGALQIVSVLIFWIWPTTYPRHLFPAPEDIDALTYYAITSLRSIDQPNNCAPSLHVSGCFLSSFVFLNEQRRKFPFFFGWALLIAMSTLTTKQHYVIDVVTGFMLAVIVYWIFYKFAVYRPLPSADHASR